MPTLEAIKQVIWNHRKVKRNIIDLQVYADKAEVRLPINTIENAEKLLKLLNKGSKKPKVTLPDVYYKRYRDAKYNHQSKEFPNWIANGHFIEPDKPDIGTSNGLTAFIVDFLTWSGHFANRTGNEGRVIIKAGKPVRIGSSSKNGMQDIDTNITHPNHRFGIPWKIEIKIGKDVHRANQKAFGLAVSKTGGHYSVVRTVEDFFEQYDKLLLAVPEQGSIFV